MHISRKIRQKIIISYQRSLLSMTAAKIAKSEKRQQMAGEKIIEKWNRSDRRQRRK